MSNTELSDELAAMFAEHAGEGISTDAQDQVTPYVNILQPLSPQVLKNNEKYLEGAEAGDILYTPSGRIWRGSEGIDFQPVASQHIFVEWKPREQGGGFVGNHLVKPKEMRETRDPQNPNRRVFTMPGGTQIVDTLYLQGFILDPEDPNGDLPAILAFKSTGHKVFRKWNDYMKAQRLPNGGGEAPARSRHYRLTTEATSNNKGTWYEFKVEDLGWQNDTAQWLRSTQLFDDIQKGKVLIGAPPVTLAIEDHSEEVPF